MEQLDESPELGGRVQVTGAEKSVVTVTVCDGVIAVPGLVSDTLTVHADCPFIMTGLGLQITEVEVERRVTVKLDVPRLAR